MELMSDRGRLGRALDESLAAIFSAAIGTIVLVSAYRGPPDFVPLRELRPIVLFASLALLLLVVLRTLVGLRIAFFRKVESSRTALNFGHLDLVDLRGRDPGWMPMRYLVLSIPILSFLLGVPTAEQGSPRLDELEEFRVHEFLGLAQKAEVRERYAGIKVRVTGRLSGASNKGFTLFEHKIGRSVHLELPIDPPLLVVIDETSAKGLWEHEVRPPVANHSKVVVTGYTSFMQTKNGEFVALLIVKPSQASPMDNWIKEAPPEFHGW
jgi:hypothetical protein